METKKLIVLSDFFAYKLYYMLLKSQTSSVIHIRADKYEKKSFLFGKNSPRLSTETNFALLPLSTTTYEEAENLCKKIFRNRFFPSDLDFLSENKREIPKNGTNNKIKTGFQKKRGILIN